MIAYNEFERIWNNMPIHANGYISLGIDHPLDLHIGYHSDDSKSLVVLNTGIVSDIPSSFAIYVKNIELSDGSWILEFQLLKNSYDEIFLRLCWDMIDISCETINPLKDLISRYLSWQKFLQYIKKDVISLQMQKGLLGELLFMQMEMKKDESKKDVILNSWVGPDGSDQDFVFPNKWAEIKAVAMSAEVVNISSLQQLDRNDEGTLEVYFLEETTSGVNRIYLTEVVKYIRSLLSDCLLLLDRFDMKLFKYGYQDSDTSEYDKHCFRLTDLRTYNVNKEFPRLIRCNTADEIVNCTYTLSLAAIEKYRKR